ncbi:MAG: 6-bladed beta-propeller [Bacteroidaceae bacterium]|nr:6-bladed beta-propeller [Bacteroidaceae bacterium]
MRIITVLILYVVVAVSCSHINRTDAFESLYASDSINLELSDPGAIYIHGDYLFLIDRKAISDYIQVYDIRKKEFLFSFAPMGQGPGEYVSLASMSFYEQEGTELVDLYDFNHKVCTYLLDDIMEKRESVIPFKEKFVNDTGLTILNLYKTRNGYISTGMFPEGRFGLLSDTMMSLGFTGSYRKKPNESISDEVHFMASYGLQYLSDDKQYLADCVTTASVLTLYELRGQDVIKKWEYLIEELDYEIEADIVPVRKSSRGYVSVSFSSEYVYAIYSGESPEIPDAYGNEIHVFDLDNGELVKKLILDRKSSHIVVDEHNGKMYIETDYPEPVVLIYDLPLFI